MKLKELIVSPRNVRQPRDEDDVSALSDSIQSRKLISKLVLRPGKKDGTYEVVAGQRRFKALVKAYGDDHELSEDEYILMQDLDDKEAFLLSLEENQQRVNLSPLELNRAARELNVMGFKDAQIAKNLNVTPYRLKRLYALSEDKNRIPEAAVVELRKPTTDAKFTDAHWLKLRDVDDPDVVKDVVDYIIDKETPPRDIPTIIKAVEKNHGLEDSGKGKETPSKNVDDGAPEDTGGPVKYEHKGELILEEHDDDKIFRVIGKEEDDMVPIAHYLEYLRHPDKFRCYVNFKLTIKPRND